jgi:SAM-dependent methyltransferase
VSDQTLRGSPDRFGYEWGRYRTVLPEHRRQLERWLGSTGLESFAGKRVLDVGCGMGRNPYWYHHAGAQLVLAADVDDSSLEAARSNLAELDGVSVEKISVYELDPDRHGRFDRVTCVGVLHHLADPPLALERMWACVEPGGDLVLWCYGREGNRLFLPAIQALRWLGSRLPLPLTHALAASLSVPIWLALRILPFRVEYYRHLRTLSFRNLRSIVFDQMLPHIAHYWTRAEMHELVAALPTGSPQVELVQGNSWACRVSKTAG